MTIVFNIDFTTENVTVETTNALTFGEGGGGGGAVDSVNGQTGVVTLTTTNINEGTNLYFTNARAIAALAATLASYVTTTALNTALSAYVTAVSLAATLANYVTNSSLASTLTSYLQKNAPITGATKTKITYDPNGLVTAGADATATDVDALKRDGSNANSDIDIGNFKFNGQSFHVKGTGGNGHIGLKHQSSNITASGSESSLGANNSGNPVWKNDGNAIQDIMLRNADIVAATKTKITYDAKGLVTSGTDATTADINDSSNRRYVTDAQLTVIGNTSGTNTGDNATNSQYSGLAALINKLLIIDLSTAASSTTNQVETILRTIPVTANDVASGDIVWLSQQISTSQTSGTFTVRARIGTAAVPANIALETLVLESAVTSAAGGSYVPINQYISFLSGNVTGVLRAVFLGQVGIQLFDVAAPPLNATWYIYITCQKSIAGGTVTLKSSLIKRERL